MIYFKILKLQTYIMNIEKLSLAKIVIISIKHINPNPVHFKWETGESGDIM